MISLSFLRLDTSEGYHRMWDALMNALSYCRNAVQLSLPTYGIGSKEVKIILLQMEQLQSLTIHWFRGILDLLKRITKNGKNLKEVTVTEFWLDTRGPGSVAEAVKPWVQYWIEKKFVPRKLNLVFMNYNEDRNGSDLEEYLLIESHKSLSSSPAGCYGQINLYTGLEMPLDLAPVLLIFQVEFGQTASFPFALNADSCGFSKSDYLILTECTRHKKVIHRAILKQTPLVVPVGGTTCNFKVLTEFSAFSCDIYSNQLEQLAVACPNLQRLNLEQNKHCLKMLQGLHTVASSCLNLEGLNLKGIPSENIESQAYLWEILSDMKLTHLAVDLWILLPSNENNQYIKLVSSFQKFCRLEALEVCNHRDLFGVRPLVSGIPILSHFPSLIHFVNASNNGVPIAFHDIVTSCKQLKYLWVSGTLKCLSTSFNCNLQQLYIDIGSCNLSDEFMRSVSAHGGLVHVKLIVLEVTSEGVTALIMNSPNLLTFQAFLFGYSADTFYLGKDLRKRMSDRKLFKCHGYQVDKLNGSLAVDYFWKPVGELMSLWR